MEKERQHNARKYLTSGRNDMGRKCWSQGILLAAKQHMTPYDITYDINIQGAVIAVPSINSGL